jgi:hypothetical protein
MVISAQKNSKNIIEAILLRLCTGATWHDIPQELCPLQTAYNRFHRMRPLNPIPIFNSVQVSSGVAAILQFG